MNKKVIFDTCILVSVLIYPKREIAKIFKKSLLNYKVITSNAILEEIFDVITRKKFDQFRDIEERISWFNIYKRSVEINPVNIIINDCLDPKDNKFLELAVSSNADVIVSSDPHLLNMNPYKNIEILNISDFQKKYLSTNLISTNLNKLFEDYLE